MAHLIDLNQLVTQVCDGVTFLYVETLPDLVTIMMLESLIG